MLEFQVTLFDKENRYKPISTIVKCESAKYFNRHQQEIKRQGIIKICQKRYWTQRDLKRYGYTICKIRFYDKKD